MNKKAQDAAEVNPPKAQIEVKLIKHIFSAEERDELGMTLARAHQQAVEIDHELEQVKTNFKARLAVEEATISRASSARLAGFEMRNKRCRVVFRPKDREKDYFLEFADDSAAAVLTEAMTEADQQALLLPEAARMDALCEIPLWTSAADGPCVMKVARLPGTDGHKSTWFAALDVKVGLEGLRETLDDDQPCSLRRIDIIQRAARRLKVWLVKVTSKAGAEGFNADIDAAVEGQREREE